MDDEYVSEGLASIDRHIRMLAGKQADQWIHDLAKHYDPAEAVAVLHFSSSVQNYYMDLAAALEPFTEKDKAVSIALAGTVTALLEVTIKMSEDGNPDIVGALEITNKFGTIKPRFMKPGGDDGG